jgi:pimeloyl-ACP methyl ester carboxylesterase
VLIFTGSSRPWVVFKNLKHNVFPMKSSRIYGSPPYSVVLIHGGPGAPGSLAPVAGKLSESRGVVEVLNNGTTIGDQLFEIYEEVIRSCDLPVVLVGHSWGSWLSLIFVSKYPQLVSKIILMGTPPFDKEYAKEIMPTRMKRLDDRNKELLTQYLRTIDSSPDSDDMFRRTGNLLSLADSFEPAGDEDHVIAYRYDVFRNVWAEAEKMRQSGKLLNLAKGISCPVVAIHGNYDPHPFQGVHQYLKDRLPGFKMHIIDKCGHYPWNETHAADNFYNILTAAIQT